MCVNMRILSTSLIIALLFSFVPIVGLADRKSEIMTLDWSSRGDLAVGYNDMEKIRIYNRHGGQIAMSNDEIMYVKTIAWNPDGTRIAYTIEDETDNIWVWDVGISTPQLVPSQYGAVKDIAWNADGNQLAVATQISVGPGAHNYLSTWDTTTFREIMSIEIPYSEFFINSIDWNPVDERQVVTSAYDGRLYVWDIESKTDLIQLSVVDESCFWPYDPAPDIADYELPTCDAQEVSWNPIGNKLAASASQGVWIWDTSTWEAKIFGLQNQVIVIEWNKPGQLAAISQSTITIFDPDAGNTLLTIESRTSLYDIAWSPDGTQLAYGGASGELHIIDIPLLETTPEPP